VIDDGLSDAGIGGMERAVDLLADFARGGHQVVLLTSRSELADRLRAMEIMVHELPPPAGKAFEIESVVRIEPDRGVEHALSTSPSSAQPYDHGRPAHAGNGRVAPRPGEDRAPRTLAYHVSSCEEFPGELTDRARSPRGVRATVSQSNEELDAAPGDSSAIEEALAITPDSLELLRKLGLCRVGDLRRADADDAARRLRYTGITASMIRDWQARCRDWSQASRRTSSEPRPQAAKNVHSDHEAARHTPARSANAAPKLAARPEAERAEHSTETVAEGPVILAAGASSSRGGPRFYLDAGNSIADSPSIGPRMGEQLKAIGIHTVADLLKADPHSAAEQLHNRRVVAETIRQWQQQALLASRIPGLRGHDAQILVACGITRPEELAATRAENLWAKVEPFSETVEGKRIIRNGKPPDVEEVRDWIRWAAHARSSRAA
jgi:hypothetical protein